MVNIQVGGSRALASEAGSYQGGALCGGAETGMLVVLREEGFQASQAIHRLRRGEM